jgi:hypothetical protein
LPPDALITNQASVTYDCGAGHVRTCTLSRLRRNGWCRLCFWARNGEWTLKDYADYARKKGGTLLTHDLERVRTFDRLRFECREGHKWETPAQSIKRDGRWCTKCAHASRRISIATVAAFAKSRGGVLLSTVYENTLSPLRWRCAAGHAFRCSWNNASRGKWCPHCKAPRGERITRAYFEALFGEKFPKCRPSWLQGDYGVALELDGYCEARGLAFEHQGMHHYRSVEHYGRKTDVARVRRHDRKKAMLCRKHGVALIAIPEVGTLTAVSDLRQLIIDKCEAAGVPVPRANRNLVVETGGAYATIEEIERYDEIQELVTKRGGVLLSSSYHDAHTPLRVRCKCGHEWDALYGTLRRSWCQKCGSIRGHEKQRGQSRMGDKRRSVFDQAVEAAKQRRITCLSKQYVTARLPLRWQCDDCGYEWETAAYNIRQGTGCRRCSLKAAGKKRRYTMQELQAIARKRDGVCLSKEYVGIFEPLRWRHEPCGNQFEMSLNNVIHGGAWCPPCGRKRAGIKRRLTIEQMRALARKRGGKCLSEEYLGSSVPLTWQHDSCGHVFKMTPAVVKQGGWCPPCRRKEAIAKLRGTIAQMQAIARERDGMCLSEEYLGNKVRLKWRHNACGREFEMTPSLVVNRGSWCPSCRKKEGAAKREASRRRKGKTPKRATK